MSKGFGPNQLSGHAQTFPPGYRNIQEISQHLQGSSAQEEQQKKTMLGFAAYATSCRSILSKRVKAHVLMSSTIQNYSVHFIETLTINMYI